MNSQFRIKLTTCRQVITNNYTRIFPGDWLANKTILLYTLHEAHKLQQLGQYKQGCQHWAVSKFQRGQLD